MVRELIALMAVVCSLALVVSSCVWIYSILLVIVRTGTLVDKAEDRGLSWGERAGRRAQRFNAFYVADEFRSLRHILFGAWVGTIGSFGLLWLLLALGKRM
jgi:hypothetical protein